MDGTLASHPARPDYRRLGFVLTAKDAARILGLRRVADVHDLVRSGDLTALSTREHDERALLFHPDELTAYRGTLLARRDHVNERLLTRALDIVRAYLRDTPAFEDYDEAVGASAPVLCATKTGRDALHVHARTIMAGFNARDEVVLNREAPIALDSIIAALARMGGQRVRGFVAAADRGTGRPRWSWWWRLPHDVLDDVTPDVVPRVRDAGEPVRSHGGVTYIDTPLTSRRHDG